LHLESTREGQVDEGVRVALLKLDTDGSRPIGEISDSYQEKYWENIRGGFFVASVQFWLEHGIQHEEGFSLQLGVPCAYSQNLRYFCQPYSAVKFLHTTIINPSADENTMALL